MMTAEGSFLKSVAKLLFLWYWPMPIHHIHYQGTHCVIYEEVLTCSGLSNLARQFRKERYCQALESLCEKLLI